MALSDLWPPNIQWGENYNGWGPHTIEVLPDYMEGLALTIELTVISLSIGFVMAFPVALARLHRNPLIRLPAYGYMFFFRGTPLIVQLFLVYYGSGQFFQELKSIGIWWFFKEPYNAAIFTLILNTTAYSAEIFRGAIQAVPYGEIEAARAVGMSRFTQYWRIILPKAIRIGWPAYTNEVVFLFQATALVGLITLLDLFGMMTKGYSDSLRTYESYIVVGFIYLCCSYGIFFVLGKIEFVLMRHLRDREDVGKARNLIKITRPSGMPLAR